MIGEILRVFLEVVPDESVNLGNISTSPSPFTPNSVFVP